MSWFSRGRRHTVPAAQLAEDLFRIEEEPESSKSLFRVAGEDTDRTQPAVRMSGMVWPRFRDKMRLYREAIVLMLLSSQAQKERGYNEVLKSYERLILPGAATPQGIAKLEALQAAMQDISRLVNDHGERKEFSWSAAWLNEVGHTESNPVTLSLFALFWIKYYSTVAGSLAELRPG